MNMWNMPWTLLTSSGPQQQVWEKGTVTHDQQQSVLSTHQRTWCMVHLIYGFRMSMFEMGPTWWMGSTPIHVGSEGACDLCCENTDIDKSRNGSENSMVFIFSGTQTCELGDQRREGGTLIYSSGAIYLFIYVCWLLTCQNIWANDLERRHEIKRVVWNECDGEEEIRCWDLTTTFAGYCRPQIALMQMIKGPVEGKW